MGFAARRGLGKIDVGRAFDLIVGTSTGGIIACALAAGVELPCIVGLYRDHGPAIFPRRLPDRIGIRLCCDFIFRPSALRAGTAALRLALVKQFKDETLGELYARRGIAIAVPAVELSQHHSWVFKTPHLGVTTSHRDDNYRLVDVCLATTAAPIYRSLAALDHPDRVKEALGHNVFADGGPYRRA
jgi:patatin-like phospholipase/acyl hydrolase